MSIAQWDLLGRAAECERIGLLLESARLGRADRVALVGDAGIGKTALLDWARDTAPGFTVVGATGVQPEHDVAFAGLLEFLSPLLDLIPDLPGPQREALEGALALGPSRPGARFAVGAGLLGVLAGAAERAPLLLVLDDVQWLDRATCRALAFACRRLRADRVALLAACRPGGLGPFESAQFEVLELGGLEPEHALALVARSASSSLAREVADRVVRISEGNPLALLELPQLLTPEERRGEVALPEVLRVGRAVERAFASDLAQLPRTTRRALLAVALGGGHGRELRAALEGLGLSEAALAPAERSGVVRARQSHIAFRHPLIASVLVGEAAASELRRVHAAFGRTLPSGERRAWHRAAACVSSNEKVAEELEREAEDAVARRAPESAIALLERAAELSPGHAESARRLALAADAAWVAGLTESATRLAETVLTGTDDVAPRVDALHLLGQVAHQTLPPRVAQERLRGAAELADPIRAVPILMDLFTSLVYDGRPEAALETAQELWSIVVPDGGLHEFFACHCLGIALLWNGRRDDGAALVLRALELVEQEVLRDDPRHLAVAGMDAAWLDDAKRGAVLSERAIALARETGAVAALPALLKFAAWAQFDDGRWSAAYATGSEALALAEETGQTAQICACHGVLLWVSALSGREEDAYRHAHRALALADALELPWHRAGFVHALGLLELGLGRLEPAVDRFEEMRRLIELRGIRLVAQSSAPDHVEALVRSGKLESARARLAELELLAEQDDSALGRSLLLRCHGLVAAEDEFASLFEEAIREHPAGVEDFWLARTRLCYGERLRRSGRRRDARVELEAALVTFERLGAEVWAARARSELVASGRRLRRRDPSGHEELTPQELQIAIHVARGLSNREIAQTLFLSPKTVESHLTRIYRRLDLHARAELVDRFADQVERPPL